MRQSVKVIYAKYESWAKILIEPATFNDARLFSLETRIDKEEEQTYELMAAFKDLIKKLVFTFE